MSLEHGLLCGTKARGVGDGAGKDTHHIGDFDIAGGVVDCQRDGDVQGDEQYRQPVEAHASLLERGEETGANLQSDGEDKQNQTKFLDKLEYARIDAEAEVADEDADKEDKSDAKRDALDFCLAKDDADGDDDGVDEDGVGHAFAVK